MILSRLLLVQALAVGQKPFMVDEFLTLELTGRALIDPSGRRLV